MFKGIFSRFRKKPKLFFSYLLLSFTLLAFLTVIILFWWSAGERAEQQIINQAQENQLILARAGSAVVESYFQDYRVELLNLSRSDSVQALQEVEGRQALEEFVDHLKDKTDPFLNATRVDKQGIVVWTANIAGIKEGEGVSVADRGYFTWAQQQSGPGEVFISQPLIGRDGLAQGKLGIVMAVPVFYQDQFNGLVFSVVILEDFTEEYVLPLSSRQVFAAIVNQEGKIIASSLKEVVNKDFADYAGLNKQETADLVIKLQAGREDSLVHDCSSELAGSGQMKMLSSYAPIRVDGRNWALMICSPYEFLKRSLSPYQLLHTGGLTTILTGLIVVSLVFVFGMRLAQREGFIDGYKNGYHHKKKRG